MLVTRNDKKNAEALKRPRTAMPPSRIARTIAQAKRKQVVCAVCERGEGTLRRITPKGPNARYAHAGCSA